MSIELRELQIPDGVFDEEGAAVEFIRFWVAGSKDYVTLNMGGFEPKDEARQWGYIVADIAKHAVRGMQQDDPSRGTPEQMMAEIQKGYFERLEHEGVNLTGQIKADKQ